MSALQEVINSVSHMPHWQDMDHPIEGGAAALGVAAMGLRSAIRRYNKTEEAYTADNPNPAVLEQSIKEVAGDKATPDAAGNRRARLLPVGMMAAGAAIFVGDRLAQTYIPQAKVDNAANTAVCIDRGYPMIKVEDILLNGIKVTRADAVDQGFRQAKYNGNLAVFQVGDNVQPVIPPTKNWRTHETAIAEQAVDPNGGNIADCLDEAEGALPLAGSSNTQREGTVDIISPGSGIDTESLAAEINKLRGDGVKLEAVVVGTPEQSPQTEYTTYAGGQSYDGSANPGVFSDNGIDKVTVATTGPEAVQAVAKSLNDAGTVEQKLPDWLFSLIGGGIFTVGYSKLIWRVLGRRV